MEEIPVPKSEVDELKDLLAREKVNTLEWCRLNVQLAKALYNLFCSLEYSDPQQAVQHLYDSANIGFKPALIRLYPEKKTKKSEKVDLKPLSAHDAFILGLQARAGVGRGINVSLAFECFMKAAEQGYAPAQCELGLYYDNFYGVRLDPSFRSSGWYEKAGEQGNAKAQWARGVTCLAKNYKNYEEAVKWFQKAAEQGYAKAQHDLAASYVYGQGVALDYAEAVKWFQKAAEQEDSAAQNALGVMYDLGHGVVQDYAEATKWYRKAAEQGNSIAQYNLGGRYDKGFGSVAQDYVEAAKWYRKAAEQENAQAQNSLKVCADKTGIFTVHYHAAMFSFNREKLFSSDKVDKLIKDNPNEFFEHLIVDEFLNEEKRYSCMKKLFDHQRNASPNDQKLNEVDCVTVSMEVATYRYSHLSQTGKRKGSIKITDDEIHFLKSLLNTIPEGHQKYAEAQQILSSLINMKNPDSLEANEAYLKAMEADPSREFTDEFPDLTKEIEKQKGEEKKKKWKAEKKSLVGFWREETLKPAETERKGKGKKLWH